MYKIRIKDIVMVEDYRKVKSIYPVIKGDKISIYSNNGNCEYNYIISDLNSIMDRSFQVVDIIDKTIYLNIDNYNIGFPFEMILPCKKIYCAGDEFDGDEIINSLIRFGGKDSKNFMKSGTKSSDLYFILPEGDISSCHVLSETAQLVRNFYIPAHLHTTVINNKIIKIGDKKYYLNDVIEKCKNLKEAE